MRIQTFAVSVKATTIFAPGLTEALKLKQCKGHNPVESAPQLHPPSAKKAVEAFLPGPL